MLMPSIRFQAEGGCANANANAVDTIPNAPTPLEQEASRSDTGGGAGEGTDPALNNEYHSSLPLLGHRLVGMREDWGGGWGSNNEYHSN